MPLPLPLCRLYERDGPASGDCEELLDRMAALAVLVACALVLPQVKAGRKGDTAALCWTTLKAPDSCCGPLESWPGSLHGCQKESLGETAKPSLFPGLGFISCLARLVNSR